MFTRKKHRLYKKGSNFLVTTQQFQESVHILKFIQPRTQTPVIISQPFLYLDQSIFASSSGVKPPRVHVLLK